MLSIASLLHAKICLIFIYRHVCEREGITQDSISKQKLKKFKFQGLQFARALWVTDFFFYIAPSQTDILSYPIFQRFRKERWQKWRTCSAVGVGGSKETSYGLFCKYLDFVFRFYAWECLKCLLLLCRPGPYQPWIGWTNKWIGGTNKWYFPHISTQPACMFWCFEFCLPFRNHGKTIISWSSHGSWSISDPRIEGRRRCLLGGQI